MGLPPPTRGIPGLLAADPAARGSTPAHAGNTRETSGAGAVGAVYPRPRGEYDLRQLTREQTQGLPPPTRGILPHTNSQWRLAWSTPAHAGNTAGFVAQPLLAEVYPRPRGEYGLPRQCR